MYKQIPIKTCTHSNTLCEVSNPICIMSLFYQLPSKIHYDDCRNNDKFDIEIIFVDNFTRLVLLTKRQMWPSLPDKSTFLLIK